MLQLPRSIRSRSACALLPILALTAAPADAQLTTAGSRILQQGVGGVAGSSDGLERFGAALATGDFDGDGRDELAIGAPFESDAPVSEVGAVTIVDFEPDAPGGVVSADWTLESATAEVASGEDWFGRALAAGDFDADGFDDLAIGIPGRRVVLGNGSIADAAGAVLVMYGGVGSVNSGDVAYLHREVVSFEGATGEGDRLGWALAVGDFDADGFDDLAIGAPGDDVVGFVDNGTVNVLYGSDAGLSLARDQIWNQNKIVVSGDEDGDQFGAALAAGDLDGDGFDDLAIGVPYEDYVAVADAGAIYQLIGGADGLETGSGAPFVIQETIAPDDSETDDRFGLALAAGDLDGDGTDDLVVSAPGDDYDEADFSIVDTGRVQILFGTAGLGADPDASVELDRLDFDNSAEVSDRIGAALAIGEFDGGQRREIAIGAPFVDFDVFQDAGRVFVGSGPSFAPVASPQAFGQAGPLPGVEESGDRLGEALAVGDFDGNGFDDLAIGVPYEAVGALPEAGAVNVLFSAGLFRDDFERGDLDRWSAVTGDGGAAED